MDDEASQRESVYQEALATYETALARLIAAKKARPKPAIRVGSLAHMAQVREAIWQAYLAGERDYAALAARFGRTRGNVSTVIRDERRGRALGPPTREEYDRVARYHEAYDQAIAQIAAENEWLRANGFIVTGNIGLQ